MNRKRILIVSIVLLIGILVGIWEWQRSQLRSADVAQESKPQTTAPSSATPTKQTDTPSPSAVIPDVPGAKLTPDDKGKIAKIVEVFSASIDFWGKVVDQHGDPVPGATVHYSAADKYFKDGSKYEGSSDAEGLFSISNIRGAGLYVRVAKQGYYHIDEKSAHSFGYGTPSGEVPPSKLKPAIFVLQRMGETEPLIKLETGSVLLPKDGKAHKLSLRCERGRLSSEAANGDLLIELWSDYQPPPPHGRKYNWRCRISVPGGGLAERVGEFNFEAPIENYVQAFEFTMSATTERWQPSLKKEFFLRLADGCFARVKLDIIPGGDHFVDTESYLNPIPGHRNLEFDQAKAIKPAP